MRRVEITKDFLLERSIPEPNSGCWLWTGMTNHKGYGYIVQRQGGKARYLRAHRVSYEMSCGSIAPGMLVLHRCDVRLCINPAHLYVGTYLDNSADAVRKGRLIGRRPRGPARETPILA